MDIDDVDFWNAVINIYALPSNYANIITNCYTHIQYLSSLRSAWINACLV